MVVAVAVRFGPTAAIREPSIRTSAVSKSPTFGSSERTQPPFSRMRPPCGAAAAPRCAAGDALRAASMTAALEVRKSRREIGMSEKSSGEVYTGRRITGSLPGQRRELFMTRSRLAVALSFLSILTVIAAFPVSRSAQTLNGEWRAYAGDVRATKVLGARSDQSRQRRPPADRVASVSRAARDARGPAQRQRPQQLRAHAADGRWPALHEHGARQSGRARPGDRPGRAGRRRARRRTRSGWRRQPRARAYWSDGKDARVVSISGRFLVALNGKTGKPYADFGEGGRVDLARGYDRPVQGFRWGGPPLVVRDVIVIGGVPAPATDYLNESVRAVKEAPPGDVRGFDVRTGRLSGRFTSCRSAGEFGYDTWQGGSAEYTGNSGAWSWMSADEELGYVYVPGEDATGDFYGGTRPGNNLFADTLVCLDARTGKRIWHFQAIHHPLWDYDLPAAPILADVTVNGRRREDRRAGIEAGVHLRARSRDRRADLADRRAAGAEGRYARRVVRADAARADQAAGVRSAGHHHQRPHRLHAGAAPAGARHHQ